jgi:hypothetical protein
LRALGTKNEARYNLKIVDVDRPESERGTPAVAASDNGSDDSAGDDATGSKPVKEDDADAEADAKAEKNQATANDTVARTRKELAELDDLDI